MERCKSLMVSLRARLSAGDRGSSLVEYVLLVGLIAMVCLVALNMLGLTASNKYSAVASMMSQS